MGGNGVDERLKWSGLISGPIFTFLTVDFISGKNTLCYFNWSRLEQGRFPIKIKWSASLRSDRNLSEPYEQCSFVGLLGRSQLLDLGFLPFPWGLGANGHSYPNPWTARGCSATFSCPNWSPDIESQATERGPLASSLNPPRVKILVLSILPSTLFLLPPLWSGELKQFMVYCHLEHSQKSERKLWC